MKIILYFGSFNPIHIGHVIIANYILEFVENINFIWFIVSPHNPLKKNLLDSKIRENMVRIAISNLEKMNLLEEIESGLDPSYTIHTLNRIKKKYPNIKFSLLFGKDILSSIKKWKNYKSILNKYDIFIYPRHGNFSMPILKQKNITYLINAPIIEISSSFIRHSIKIGKNIQTMLNTGVWKYINKYKIYKN